MFGVAEQRLDRLFAFSVAAAGRVRPRARFASRRSARRSTSAWGCRGCPCRARSAPGCACWRRPRPCAARSSSRRRRRPPRAAADPGPLELSRVAVTIGSSCEKSVELLVISAASTIWLLVDRGLRVVALHEPEPDRDRARVRVGHVDLPGGHVGRPMRVRPAARPPTQPVARGRAVVLVGLVGAALGVKLGLEPLGRQQQPLAPRPRDRIGVVPAVLLELALALPQPAIAPLACAPRSVRVELQRHLLGTSAPRARRPARRRLASSRRICSPGLAEELASALPACAAARAAHHRAPRRRARPRPRRSPWPRPGSRAAICSNSWLTSGLALPAIRVPSIETTPGFTRPARSHSLQHLAEQLAQRPLVPADKARDRRVIGDQVAGDHPIGHVLATVTLDRPRRALPVANAYKISATISDGSYAARP